jgi:tetratricopeptide (TPR) repeat protein
LTGYNPAEGFNYNQIAVAVIGTCIMLYILLLIFNYFVHRAKIKNLEIAMARFPNYADVRYKIAEVYYNYGDYDNAAKYYKEALVIYPYNSSIKIKLAMLILERRKDVETAFKMLAEVRFAVDAEPRAKFIIDNYLKEKKLYEKFHSIRAEKEIQPV